MVLTNDYAMTIAGERVTSNRTLPVINPATEEMIAQVPHAERPQLDAAVTAAKSAFPQWAALTHETRQAKVAALGARIVDHKQDLVRLLAMEQGRPFAGAEVEIDIAIQWCQAMSLFSLPVEVVEDDEERRVVVRHVPIGVVGASRRGTRRY